VAKEERSYAHRSLLDKLGIKPCMRTCLRGAFDDAFVRDVSERAGSPPARAARGRYDAIVALFDDLRALDAIAALREHLEPAGMLWCIAQKGKNTPVPWSALQRAILDAGLVDVKIASFSGTLTATKAVIPVAQRAKAKAAAR
jgi:hypothetical protein